MFEIESKNQDEITIITKKTKLTINISDFFIDASLGVGKIFGPGEFEIGDISVRGIAIDGGRTIYDIESGGVHVGVIGGIEDGLDELDVSDILCTSSARAIREIEPKMVIAMGNIDGMVAELKLTAKVEKRIRVKNADSLPTAMELVALN